jgi:hypothetical protein
MSPPELPAKPKIHARNKSIEKIGANELPIPKTAPPVAIKPPAVQVDVMKELARNLQKQAE